MRPHGENEAGPCHQGKRGQKLPYGMFVHGLSVVWFLCLELSRLEPVLLGPHISINRALGKRNFSP